MIVLACEGKSEVYLITQLLQRGCLVFGVNDILDHRPIHARQPRSFQPLVATLPIEEDIVIYRIGDTQRDEMDPSSLGTTREEHTQIVKVCTKPEIEILIIIDQGLYKEYIKSHGKMTPKEYVKAHVKDYFGFNDYIDRHDMVPAIKEYKRIKQNTKDEKYLADLLKN